MTERSLAHARARLAAGDLVSARNEARRVARTGSAADKAEAHLLLSACAKRTGNDATARQHVAKALSLDPDNALAQYAAAEFAEHDRDVENAIERLERAVALAPNFVVLPGSKR